MATSTNNNDTYNFKTLETKWTQHWAKEKPHTVDLENAQRPYYNLMMFPYPSAEGLHAGNLFSFVGADIKARFKRAQGYDVFQPFGFDAFGIHSENHALKVGRHPADLIPQNIVRFRRQIEWSGLMVDWDHSVDSTTPEYYRWTQWIFVQLFKAGLVYQKEAPVNWCPSCRTVLAAEQAADGTCERCEAQVEQKNLRQWFGRITAYAQPLLDNLDKIDWSPITKSAQTRWIGRSQGAKIHFRVADHSTIEVFTTRPDTLWGATFLVLAPENPLVETITRPAHQADVSAYTEASRRKTSTHYRADDDRAKTGVFSGAYALHPGTGAQIPIWISDYVAAGYGSGAIMAVPAHDQRDFDFAQTYNLPITPVVEAPADRNPTDQVYTGEGPLIQSGPFSGTPSARARGEIAAWLKANGHGGPAITYRLRDWCISRQRYWGPPIPIVHCQDCGPVPVPEDQLPVRLPHLEHFEPDGSGQSPLARCPDFVVTQCPTCQGPARRETDVSDNFLDSAWYFFRYPSAHNHQVAFDQTLSRKWLPVDHYIGGNEHAVLHLMYTRFLTMAFKDLGLIEFDEPFRCFRANGMIHKDGAKMSKSKGNVVNPDEFLQRYGADTFRTYLMFAGDFQEGGDFRTKGIAGVQRLWERLWRYATQTPLQNGPIDDQALLTLLHRQIRKVTEDLENLRYNTAVAALMELFNGLQVHKQHYRQALLTLLQLAAPLAPFITQELWERLGQKDWITAAPWPQWQREYLQQESIEWVVQINGRVRDKLSLSPNADQQTLEQAAFKREAIKRYTANKPIVKTIFVPGKLLNLVLAN